MFNVASGERPQSEVNIKISSNEIQNILDNGRILSKSVSNLDEDFMQGNICNSNKPNHFNEHLAPSLHELFKNNNNISEPFYTRIFHGVTGNYLINNELGFY